jgi:hypothetical protein
MSSPAPIRQPQASTAFEEHFTPAELARLWKRDESTIRRMFQDEPGVLRMGRDGLRIPVSIAERVKHELDLESQKPLEALLAKVQKRARGIIYFIQGEGIPLIKIGFTVRIEQRLAGLQIGSPVLLSVVAQCTGTLRGELLLHQTFNYCRAHGEWFMPDDKLRQLIELVKGAEA